MNGDRKSLIIKDPWTAFPGVGDVIGSSTRARYHPLPGNLEPSGVNINFY
jgi:hypothetical protein